MTSPKVLHGGTVVLTENVTCDGCQHSHPIGVYTHIHEDHISNFESSLGSQEPILVSKATKDLLKALKGDHLDLRRNLVGIDYGETIHAEGEAITLFRSGHILGSAQVFVETEEGFSVAYTGDFDIHGLEQLPSPDCLVLDATYGNPRYLREYPREEIVGEMMHLIASELKKGSPVFVSGSRGMLQEMMSIIRSETDVPFLMNERNLRLAEVVESYGSYIGDRLDRTCEEAREIIQKSAFVGFCSLHEKVPESEGSLRITLSSFRVPATKPVFKISERGYYVAITDHAYFDETIEYVRAVKPGFLIADNSRGGDAASLAAHVKLELGIDAKPMP